MRASKGLTATLQTGLGSRLVLEPAVRAAYRSYLRSDTTPPWGYSAMRKLFGADGSAAFEALVERAAREHPPLDLESHPGVLHEPLAPVLDGLRRDGLVVLDARLPDAVCDALERLAEGTECALRDRVPGAPARAQYDRSAPLAVRYDVPEAELLASGPVQDLLADRSLLALAQAYLGGAPVQDMVAMWWTTPSREGSSAAAQQFHFDLDRLRFLKVFAYLTDVGPDNGPHEYVRGSHRHLPRPLRADRRFSDEEVLEHYDARDTVSVTGPRGTMFAADTRGLHKGLNVAAGHRLVFQLEYTTSLFGAPVQRAVVPSTSRSLAEARSTFPSAYRRLRVES